MAWDLKKLLFFLGTLAALFWWSAWAGLAGLGLILLWVLWLFVGDARQLRQRKERYRTEIDRALAAQGLAADRVYCGYFGAGALGISHTGRKLVYAAPESMETTIYDADAAFEAHARKLPEGDFELGITVPGRVTGKPRLETVRVKQRGQAEQWLEALEPLLGAKVRSDL
jgi:hypothetical protein